MVFWCINTYSRFLALQLQYVQRPDTVHHTFFIPTTTMSTLELRIHHRRAYMNVQSTNVYPYASNLLFWLTFRVENVTSLRIEFHQERVTIHHFRFVEYLPCGSAMYQKIISVCPTKSQNIPTKSFPQQILQFLLKAIYVGKINTFEGSFSTGFLSSSGSIFINLLDNFFGQRNPSNGSC
jgi:hypothetical protein